MKPAPHGRSWPHYLLGVALETLIFVVIGPFIGTVVFMIVLGILSGTVGGPIASVFVLVAYYPLFVLGYMWAWKAAAITGIVVSAATPFLADRDRVRVLSAAVGAVVSLILVSIEMGREIPPLSFGVSLAIAGAVAALVCGLIGARLWPFAGAKAAEAKPS